MNKKITDSSMITNSSSLGNKPLISPDFKKAITTAVTAVILAMTTPSFAQTEVQSQIDSKDLKRQYKLVMKDLRKNDSSVSKAAKQYDISSKKIAKTLDEDVEYIIQDLIPTIYVDHITIKTYLGAGLNGDNILSWLYLNKRDILWGFAQEFGTRLWNFEKGNTYSDVVKYPVNYIDDHADHYLTGKRDKKRMGDVEDIFEDGVAEGVTLFKDGKITLYFPLKEIYEDNSADRDEIEASDGHALSDYIIGKPAWDEKAKSYVVTIDLNKFEAEELAGGDPVDKSIITERLFQTTMYIKAFRAQEKQCVDYIKEGTKDMRGR